MTSQKKIKKFSKTTMGVTVDTVSDYVDILSQMVAEYFNQKYKITKKVAEIKTATLNTLYGVKKQFVRTMVEVLFLVTGLLALIVGGQLLGIVGMLIAIPVAAIIKVFLVTALNMYRASSLYKDAPGEHGPA